MSHKISYTLLILFIVFYCSSSTLVGQDTLLVSQKLSKNAIYGNFSLFLSGATANGYYERMITQGRGKKGNIYSFARVGYGGIGTFGGSTTFYSAQYGFLVGSGKSYLEIAAGPTYFTSGNIRKKAPYHASIGWRIQNPGASFIFRVGLSKPELYYLGLGFTF